MESMDEGNNSPKADDDDRQTFSIDQDSSDNLSSTSSDTLLPASENHSREISQIDHVRVHPINRESRVSLPNFNIKHPNRSDNEIDSFDDEKRIIVDKHVTVSHINRATLQTLSDDILQVRINRSATSRWNMNNVTVSRGNRKLSQSTNSHQNNRQTSQIPSRQRSTVHVSRISTAATINQGYNKKTIGSKPIVTRISFVNEPSVPSQSKDLKHVSVRRTSGNSKKSP